MRVVDAKIGTRRLDGAAWHSGSAIAPDLPHGDHLVAAHDVETIELGYGETGVVGEDAHSGARWKRMVENSVLLAHGGHAQIRVQPGVRVLIEDMSEMSGGVHSQILGQGQGSSVDHAVGSARLAGNDAGHDRDRSVAHLTRSENDLRVVAQCVVAGSCLVDSRQTAGAGHGRCRAYAAARAGTSTSSNRAGVGMAATSVGGSTVDRESEVGLTSPT